MYSIKETEIPQAHSTLRDDVLDDTPLISFNDNDGFSQVQKEMLNCKIISAALENIVLGPPHPKVPEEVANYIKENVERLKEQLFTVTANPFLLRPGPSVEQEHAQNDGPESRLNNLTLNWNITQGSDKNGNTDMMNSLQAPDVPSETKEVLRDLVEKEIMNLGKNIIEMYAPLLNQGSSALPEIASDAEILTGLEKVNQHLESVKKTNHKLDVDIAALEKEKSRNFKEAVKTLKGCDSKVKEMKTVINRQTSDEATAKYVAYLKKKEEELTLNIEIEKLQHIINCNPSDLNEELEHAYASLEKSMNVMGKECQEMEEKINAYEKLGPEFEELRTEYEAVEADITSNLWIKEQLEKNSDLSLG